MITSSTSGAPLNFAGQMELTRAASFGFAGTFEQLLQSVDPGVPLIANLMEAVAAQAAPESGGGKPATGDLAVAWTGALTTAKAAAIPVPLPSAEPAISAFLQLLVSGQPAAESSREAVAGLWPEAEEATAGGTAKWAEAGDSDSEDGPEPATEETFLNWAAMLMPPPAITPPPRPVESPRAIEIAFEASPLEAATSSPEHAPAGEERPEREVSTTAPSNGPAPVAVASQWQTALAQTDVVPMERAAAPVTLAPVKDAAVSSQPSGLGKAVPQAPRQVPESGREELGQTAIEVQVSAARPAGEDEPARTVTAEPRPARASASPAAELPTQGPRVEPARAEAARAEAVRAEVVRAEPVRVEPVRVEPVRAPEASVRAGEPVSAKVERAAPAVVEASPPSSLEEPSDPQPQEGRGKQPGANGGEPAATAMPETRTEARASSAPQSKPHTAVIDRDLIARVPDIADRPVAPVAAQSKSIVIDLKSSTGEDVQMAVRDRGTSVQISLHSSDGAVRDVIRSQVSELAGNLEMAGYHVDGMSIERSRESSMPFSGGESDSPEAGQSPGREASPRNRDQQQQQAGAGADTGGSSAGQGRRNWRQSIEEELWQTL